METYQYARVSLDLYKIKIKSEDKDSKDFYTEAGVTTSIYDDSGKETKSLEMTGDNFFEENFAHRAFERLWAYGWKDPSYPLEKLGPIFAKMGNEGWEVIEFKFDSGPNSFANALLKRKVQKD